MLAGCGIVGGLLYFTRFGPVRVSTVGLVTINEGERGTIEFPRDRAGAISFRFGERTGRGKKGDGCVSDVRCDDGDGGF